MKTINIYTRTHVLDHTQMWWRRGSYCDRLSALCNEKPDKGKPCCSRSAYFGHTGEFSHPRKNSLRGFSRQFFNRIRTMK